MNDSWIPVQRFTFIAGGVSDMIQDDVKRLIKKTEKLVSEIISVHGISRESILSIIESVYRDGDEYVSVSELKENVASRIECNVGCCYCCHTRVSVTPAESLIICHHIKSRYSLKQMDTLMKRIVSILRQLKEKAENELELFWSKTPCVFLDNDKCSIYSVRPFICRAWHSLSKDQCQRAFESENQDAEIDSTPFRGMIYGTLRKFLNDFSESNGCSTTRRDLPTALRITLAHNDPFEAWLRGENLFQ